MTRLQSLGLDVRVVEESECCFLCDFFTMFLLGGVLCNAVPAHDSEATESGGEAEGVSKYSILQSWYSSEPKMDDICVNGVHKRGLVKKAQTPLFAQVDVKLARLCRV